MAARRSQEAQPGRRPTCGTEPVTAPITDPTDHAALWAQHEHAPENHKRKAQRDLEILRAFAELEKAGASKTEALRHLRERFGRGVSKAKLWRLRRAVQGQDPGVWLPLLLPRWRGKTARAEFSPGAQEWIRTEWGRPSKPALAPIYRRALQMAPERGWRLPSLDAVRAWVNTQPEWWRVLTREGEKALARLYPAQRRDYSSLELHQLWCADGHRADVWVRWDDGSVGRPIVVAWLEVRSRVVLGHKIGRTESADLIRLAFRRAAENAGVLPQEALIDNGRGFAAKLLTGGTPNRYRFRVLEEDVVGILPLLGVTPIWATPGHGQAKPIESWFRVVSELAKRSEFGGAYCGNRPEAKPDGADAENAVPVEVFRRVLDEEIAAYHARPHRGDGMQGKTPMQVYEDLVPHATPRKPTAEQLRLCLLAAQNIRLREDGIVLLGNRYWAEPLAELRRDKTYTVRFDPEDARQPVAVYDRGRYVCEAVLIDPAGFRDQVAAKHHAKARREFIRAKKEEARAIKRMAQAQGWSRGIEADPPAGGDPGAIALPTPKVVTLFRPAIEQPRAGTGRAASADESPELTDEEITRLLAEERRRRLASD